MPQMAPFAGSPLSCLSNWTYGNEFQSARDVLALLIFGAVTRTVNLGWHELSLSARLHRTLNFLA